MQKKMNGKMILMRSNSELNCITIWWVIYNLTRNCDQLKNTSITRENYNFLIEVILEILEKLDSRKVSDQNNSSNTKEKGGHSWWQHDQAYRQMEAVKEIRRMQDIR